MAIVWAIVVIVWEVVHIVWANVSIGMGYIIPYYGLITP